LRRGRLPWCRADGYRASCAEEGRSDAAVTAHRSGACGRFRSPHTHKCHGICNEITHFKVGRGTVFQWISPSIHKVYPQNRAKNYRVLRSRPRRNGSTTAERQVAVKANAAAPWSNLSLRIGEKRPLQRSSEEALKIPPVGNLRTELLAQCHPGHPVALRAANAVEPMRQPTVDVERQWIP